MSHKIAYKGLKRGHYYIASIMLNSQDTRAERFIVSPNEMRGDDAAYSIDIYRADRPNTLRRWFIQDLKHFALIEEVKEMAVDVPRHASFDIEKAMEDAKWVDFRGVSFAFEEVPNRSFDKSEHIEFTFRWKSTYLSDLRGGFQLPEVQKQARLLEAALGIHLNEAYRHFPRDIRIVCRSDQFAKFIIMRNDLGITNGIKELSAKIRPRAATAQPPASPIDVTERR